MKLKNRILPFYQAIPKLLKFQIVSFIFLSALTWALSALFSLMLGISGKAAVTSGDMSFLFTSLHGYAMIILILVMVLSYIAVELNALLIYCNKTLDGESPSVWACIRDGFIALKKYASLRGIVVIIYAVFISPLLGLGFSISPTESFYIPRFIMSVINANPVFRTGYIILMIVLAIIAIIYCFILHGALLDDMTMEESGVQSRKLMKANWKNFIREIIIFNVLGVLVTLLLVLIPVILLLIANIIPMGDKTLLFCDVLFASIVVVILLFAMMLSVSFVLIKLTTLYKKYRTDDQWSYQKQEKKRHPVIITVAILVFIGCVVFSIGGTYSFNEVFHASVDTEIIAHRAGGIEAPENTVKGIEVAYELGATGSEIDIQRTADGYYVVNHDPDFERVAGVSKTSTEMTLAEIKELRVDGEPVPTLEEMLEASRDKVTLFVELKGDTADNQMADDAVRTIKEMGMEKQAVLISLKYDILEYIEQKYPEMLTGYLAFISLGQIEETPFDYLALEEEISTDDTIAAVHQKGKKIMVWTVNDDDDIEYFMTSEADAIITDSVKLAGEKKRQLSNRQPLDVIIQRVSDLIQ